MTSKVKEEYQSPAGDAFSQENPMPAKEDAAPDVSETLRVHAAAKELGIPPRDLIQKLADAGVSVVNHMSFISREELMGAMDAPQVKPEASQPEGPRVFTSSDLVKDHGPTPVQDLRDMLGVRQFEERPTEKIRCRRCGEEMTTYTIGWRVCDSCGGLCDLLAE